MTSHVIFLSFFVLYICTIVWGSSRRSRIKYGIVLIFLWGSGHLRAENLIDEVYKGWSQKTNPIEARQEILKKATQEVSLKYIKQMIGEIKAVRYQSAIQSKVLNQSDKYVLLIKGRNLRGRQEGGFQMTVNMKLSAKNLREALLSEGLLYQLDGPPKVIPMIFFVDKIRGMRLNAWEEGFGQSPLYPYLVDLEKEFKEKLFEKGFYFISPLDHNLLSSLPRVFLLKNTEEYDRDIAMFFGAMVVIQGSVTIDKDMEKKEGLRVDVHLQGVHASHGRVIGELVRVYRVGPGPFHQVVPQTLSSVYPKMVEDLLVQLYRAWKQGIFGTLSVNLVLNGSLNYHQLSQFKKLLVQRLRSIKQVKERLFEPLRVTFELDSDVGSRELANHLKKEVFPRFTVEVVSVKDHQVHINVSNL